MPGAALSYTIVVTNAGPSDVTDARVQDALPPALAGFSWTCTANPPASCGTPSGAGNIDALVTLPVGNSRDLHGERNGAGGNHRGADQRGNGDPAAGGDRSRAGQQRCDRHLPVEPQADLAITKTSSPNPYVPGAALTYTIMVSNAGPCDVTNARVQDALPPPLAGFTWTCTPTAPARLRHADGHRRHRCAGDAAGRHHVTFTVTGTVPAGTAGPLVNTATVTPPVGT